LYQTHWGLVKKNVQIYDKFQGIDRQKRAKIELLPGEKHRLAIRVRPALGR
jgi:hypothetical protein